MFAIDDVTKELLCLLELRSLCPDPPKSSLDDFGSAGFTAREYDPHLGQTHANALTRLENAQAVDVLFGVLAVARRRAARHHNIHIIPVPKHMHLNAESPGCFADLHRTIVSS